MNQKDEQEPIGKFVSLLKLIVLILTLLMKSALNVYILHCTVKNSFPPTVGFATANEAKGLNLMLGGENKLIGCNLLGIFCYFIFVL